MGNPNDPQLATSNYALTHRITSFVRVNIPYAKFFRTSVALFYSGNSGQKFTYLVNGDLNSDGQFGNDLLYVPRDGSEINFVDILNSDNTVRISASDQASAFAVFVGKDRYLNTRRGNYTERNQSNTPWEHVVDMRIAQDFLVGLGENKHSLQITFDVFNFTNLLNKDWGRQYNVANQAYNLLTAVNRTTGPVASRGKGYNFTPNQTPWNLTFASRFQGQIGIRYSFN